MEFDIGRLRMGEKIAGVAAVLLFIDMFFFHWFKAGVSVSGANPALTSNPLFTAETGRSASFNAWHTMSVIRWLLLLTVIVTVVMVVLRAGDRTVALPVPISVVAAALGALSTIFVLYRTLISHPGGSAKSAAATFAGITVKASVTTLIWGWIGLVICAALTYGAYLAMRDEGVTVADARSQAAGAFSSATSPRDPGSPSPPAT